MKKNSLNIHIPNPCNENWDKMTPDGNGRHCHSCGKTVIDFSRFTDHELVEFWKKAKGKLCGRFSEYQINRPIPIPVENNSIFHKALFGTALAAGLGAVANGQTTTKTMPTIQVPLPANRTGISEKNKQEKRNDYPNHISGIVTDSKTKKPLSNVEVFIAYPSVIYTDSTGKFTISIPDSMQGKTIALNFDNYEHKSRTISLSPKKQANYMKVEMEYHEEVFLMGEPAYPYPQSNTGKDSTSH